ncbi:TPA: hypothetical protein P0E28_000335 [Vibrio campbellii]|nr:hypothetical protein [Vibrio campbellii]
MPLEKLIIKRPSTSSGGGYRPVETLPAQHASPQVIKEKEEPTAEFEFNIKIHCSLEELNTLTVGVFSLSKTKKEDAISRWNKSTKEDKTVQLTAMCLYEEERRLYRDLFFQAGHAESYIITPSSKGNSSIQAEFVPIKLAIQPVEAHLAWATEGYFYHFIDEKLHMEYQVTGNGKWSLQVTFSRDDNLSNELVSDHHYTSCVLPYKVNQTLVANQYVFYQKEKLTVKTLSQIDAGWLDKNASRLELDTIVKTRHQPLLVRHRQEHFECNTATSPIESIGTVHLTGDAWGDYQTSELSDGCVHILEDKTISDYVPIVNVKATSTELIDTSRFYYTPFTKNLDVLISEAFGMFNTNGNNASILFNNANQAKKFASILETEKDLIIAVNATNRGISQEESQTFFEQVDEFYQTHYQIKYDNTSDLSPIVHVVGHGRPEGDSLASTPDESEEIFTFELVKKLKDLKLPPSSIIKLDFCWSACQLRPENITREKALQHIKNGELELLFGDPSNSFLGEFTQELAEGWPEFKGVVVGYYGSVMNTLKDNVLSKDGSWVRAYATEIELTDGILLMHKDEFKKTIHIK